MVRLVRSINERLTGSESVITNEVHAVGEDTAHFVFLDEAPLEETPSSVSIAGFTEVSGVPADNQFRVYYAGRLRGAVEFNAADDGAAVQVSYKGVGSSVIARYPNRVMDRIEGSLLTLTDAATIAWDFAEGWDAKVTLGGNRTLGAPTNVRAGASGNLLVIQGGPGSRTLEYNAVWLSSGGTDPTLTTTAGAIDVISYVALSSTQILFTLSHDHK